ncbi:MAG TPA: helicase-related protein [Caulobacteraceae bacterium]|nr:helicase-related protein [Caulobacteraceae bacterium]
MSSRPIGPPPRLAAILGPTNTGKTHLAVERMLGHASGMIGLPLRLLAREIYDRIARLRGARAVALITGEEKIVPDRAAYFVCTVEAMPLWRRVEFLAVDEIQLLADPERGHVFTDRLLHARGDSETLFLGAASAAALVRRLVPGIELQTRQRFSKLSWSGSRKLTRLPARSAVVAFSAEAVYAIAELVRRQRGGAAVVMGSLSPRTRNAQVALYQSGEVDFLVATDAIGMGLNMDLDHVAFASLTKFDGTRLRPLQAQEIAQIAGRAGRHHRDGAFGVTAACEPLDPELIASVEEHRFDPLQAAEWRNTRLDLTSLRGLLASLAQAPDRPGLRLTKEALDERVLRALAVDPAIAEGVRERPRLARLWQACQTPDFRKTSFEEHLRLVRSIFEQLGSPGERISEAWMASQFAELDRPTGGIDALSHRLAGVRTLTYIAHRRDWLATPEPWREATRRLEDRLSDELHEALVARFVDRRTSVLVRSLAGQGQMLAGVAKDGTVTVEGQFVGRLEGLGFVQATGASALEAKMLRAAAERVVGPEIARRLGTLAADSDDGFALLPDGLVLWRGAAAGRLANGRPFNPVVRLLGEAGSPAVRERAMRRLESFLSAEAGRRLAPLARLAQAYESGAVRGLARGLAWRLIEGGGIAPRAGIEVDVRALSQRERRVLKDLGVRFGRFCLHLPSLRRAPAAAFARPFALQGAGGATLQPLAEAGAEIAPMALGLAGLVAAGGLLVPVEALEALDRALRAAPRRSGGLVIAPEALAAIGWEQQTAMRILRAFGLSPARGRADGQEAVWRWRQPRLASGPSVASPFAVLAALGAQPRRRGRRRRSRPQRQAGG